MWISWAFLILYMYGLPWWSKVFSDKLGLWRGLCLTPAELIQCGDGQDYLQIAKQLGRERDGQLFGCSCGEGVFAEWACPVQSARGQTNHFSIGYFIATANGTGGFAAAAFLPMLFMWIYSPGANSDTFALIRRKVQMTQSPSAKMEEVDRDLSLVSLTQFVFQVFFGMFMFFTVCVFPHVHDIVVLIFVLAEIVHFLAVAHLLRSSEAAEARLIVLLSVFAIVVLMISFILTKMPPSFIDVGSAIQLYAFWLGECTGLATIAAITPLLVCWAPAEQLLSTDP